MAGGKNHRPANVARGNWFHGETSVATPVLQNALWEIAASAPERFVQGCKDAGYSYLSELPWWFDFKATVSCRFQAEFIIVLAHDLGIEERSPRTHATPGYLNRR